MQHLSSVASALQPCCCSTLLCRRFELEDNLLSDDELQLHRLGKHSSVVYCYELQLDAAMHRKGLGRRLMQMLELLVGGAGGWLRCCSAGACCIYAVCLHLYVVVMPFIVHAGCCVLAGAC
jgi:GNAT superfamily N-acetyltransferase